MVGTQALCPPYSALRTNLTWATAGAASSSGPADQPHGRRSSPTQNIENNPMQSSLAVVGMRREDILTRRGANHRQYFIIAQSVKRKPTCHQRRGAAAEARMTSYPPSRYVLSKGTISKALLR
jgi:hypothetical protein